jgi:hypothetical protein
MICKAWEGAPTTFKSLKMEKNWERSAKVFGDRLVVSDGPVYRNWSWNWWYSLLLLGKVRLWPTLVQTHFWGVSSGWSTTYGPFCRVASGTCSKSRSKGATLLVV